jgi:hypothetical protein
MEKFLKDISNVFLLIEWDNKHSEMSGNNLNNIEEYLKSFGYNPHLSLHGDIFFHKK